MSLPISSKNSKESRKVRAATAVGGHDLDFGLKLQAASALSAAGHYCRINVALSAVAGDSLADVTDVDVFGIRHDLTFAPRIVAISCKAGANLPVARELFYLRGVLDYLHGDEGILLLGKKPIATQLRDLGRRLDLLCLHGPEIDRWAQSLVRGLHNPGYFDERSFAEYSLAIAPQPGPTTLLSYLRTEFWFHRDFRNLQNVIALLKKAPRLNGEHIADQLRYLDTAAQFSLAILDLCRHVRLTGLELARTTIDSYLFGSETNLKARRDLYSNLETMLKKTGVVSDDAKLPPLVPPYTERLAEMVTRFVAWPNAAVLVPLVLQDALWRAVGAVGMDSNQLDSSVGLGAQKFADELLTFMKDAAERDWCPTIMK